MTLSFDVWGVSSSVPVPADPAIGLAFWESRVAFANPGEPTVFELSVANDAPGSREFDLAFANVSRPLRLEVLPTADVTVPAHSSVRIGVLAAPPAAAAEGEIYGFNLEVRAPGQAAPLASIDFTVKATTGVDLEPEDFHREADDGPAQNASHATPEPPVAALVAFVAAIACRPRRGRAEP
jgi:hypothetical protein